MTPDQRFQDLLAEAERDPNVVGLFLGGSRGKDALVTKRSDFDVRLVIREEALAEYEERYPLRHGDPVDLVPCSITELRNWPAWDRYSFTHVRVLVDKTGGELQRLVDEIGSAAADAAPALDGYVNAYYRAAKNLRDGRELEGRLDAAESAPLFLEALFALHGRVRPFNKYLPWELRVHPLGGAEWRADALLPRLERIVATGAIEEQQALFRDAERLARERGHGATIDGWAADLPLLRGHVRGLTPDVP